MKKSTITTVIALLIILTVCLYFISGTYARYADSRSGNAQVSVAKWEVSITDGESPLNNQFKLPFTVQENANVVSGKIAPGTTATATIDLDLTGTEVAVDFEATISEENLSTVFGESADDVKVTTAVTGATSGGTSGVTTIQLPGDGQAFTQGNGKIEITITLTWTNNDEHNTSDTTVGKAGSTLDIPVTLTLKQHIGA